MGISASQNFPRATAFALSSLILLTMQVSITRAQQSVRAATKVPVTKRVNKRVTKKNDGEQTSSDIKGDNRVIDPKDPDSDNSKKSSESSTTEVTRQELNDMKLTIKLLEAKVKELETKLEKSAEETNKIDATSAIAATDNKPANTIDSQTTAATLNTAVVSAPQPSGQPVEPPSSQANDAAAAPKTSPFVAFFENTEVSGLVDVYYGYNFNRPTSNTNILNFENQLRNFDTEHNQFSLNLAKLVLENKPTTDTRLGFRLDLAFGPATEIIQATEPGGRDGFNTILQGYLSYLAPVGKGIQIDIGKYATHHGFEPTESKDNWNYSRGFGYALGPYYHFGVRATIPINDKVVAMVGVNNGWNTVVDNNGRKSYSAQLAIKPTDKLTIIQNYTGGPEQIGNRDDWRHLLDTIVAYNPTNRISLATNYVYGFDRFQGARVHWQGIAGYARFQISPGFAFAPRFDYYNDVDGFMTGTRQELKAITLTAEQRVKGNFLTKLEYRRDFSDKFFFNKSIDRLVKAQSTLTAGFIYSFSSKQ